MNTSPPFALEPKLEAIAEEARTRAKSMSTAIVQLSKASCSYASVNLANFNTIMQDVKFSSRTKRKLNAFVEKWGTR